MVIIVVKVIIKVIVVKVIVVKVIVVIVKVIVIVIIHVLMVGTVWVKRVWSILNVVWVMQWSGFTVWVCFVWGNLLEGNIVNSVIFEKSFVSIFIAIGIKSKELLLSIFVYILSLFYKYSVYICLNFITLL